MLGSTSLTAWLAGRALPLHYFKSCQLVTAIPNGVK
ncbi:hypothetical protein I41_33380 [Lacipirellula limnantheis]|uniref:Uncharacterized protein n=1 Tax=Lacipirellula limnantheis TaxID=2528024 RepID=A0A517U0K7_9BACT|nr:hypothetical protein I41_33380 [Lacipirellula limnantheis]